MERKIKVWLDGRVIDKFTFDFDDDMTDEDIQQVVFEYTIENLSVEVEEV